MTTERIDSRRSGWVNPNHRPKGPNGRPLCRWCEGEIPAGSRRRTFCSDACVEEHLIRTDPAFVRIAVMRRDQGVCWACGLDTKVIDREIDEMASSDPDRIGARARARKRILRKYGIPGHRHTYWDADHIVPVVKGGGACGLENYRTLCVPCHRAATAKLTRERAGE